MGFFSVGSSYIDPSEDQRSSAGLFSSLPRAEVETHTVEEEDDLVELLGPLSEHDTFLATDLDSIDEK